MKRGKQVGEEVKRGKEMTMKCVERARRGLGVRWKFVGSPLGLDGKPGLRRFQRVYWSDPS